MHRLLTAVVIGAACLPLAAWAQSQDIQSGAPNPKAVAAQRPKPQPAPPPSIPGSRADSSLSAPAEAARIDMSPNEALFDSINRGDMIGTKDAISRGADIHARNVLGLTPLELAVDLGRNDISFLLLSLRGGAGYGATAAAAQPREPTRAERAASDRAEQIAQRHEAEAARSASRTAARAPARNARLFAGDGGSPVPQAGFLGFDAAR